MDEFVDVGEYGDDAATLFLLANNVGAAAATEVGEAAAAADVDVDDVE